MTEAAGAPADDPRAHPEPQHPAVPQGPGEDPAGPAAGPPDRADRPDETQSEQDGGSDNPSDPATGGSDYYEPL